MLWHKVLGHQCSAVSSGLKLGLQLPEAGAHQDPASLLGVLQTSTSGPCQGLAESAPTYRRLPTSSSGSAPLCSGGSGVSDPSLILTEATRPRR